MLRKIAKFHSNTKKSRLSTLHSMELHDEDLDFSDQRVTFYYADFSKCILNKPNALDEDGIFYLQGIGDELVNYNICAVAEYAILKCEDFYRTGSDESKELFRLHCEWLIAQAEVSKNGLNWYYEYDSGVHKAPWKSGISQGIGISALVRGAEAFQESRMLKFAELAANSMVVPINKGGFLYTGESFSGWIEESSTNSHILNGHIYSILGLYDLYRVTGKQKYLEGFKNGTEVIKTNIGAFDLSYTSKYDAVGVLPSHDSYHYIHCVLFRVLFRITGDEFFSEVADRWMKVFDSKLLQGRLSLEVLVQIFSYKLKKTWNSKQSK